MVISATTDWSKIRYTMLLIFATSVLLASTVATALNTSGKQKRQLFREHLLPQQGGKVPDSAFRPDRLNLNRLNQLGIYSSDGFYLEHRRPDIHLHPKPWPHETLKIGVHPDGRFVAPVGRYHFSSPRTIDTTYLIREPTKASLVPFVPFFRALPLVPQSSLQLVRHHLHLNAINRWDDILAQQIFLEFAPYLKKLRVLDC